MAVITKRSGEIEYLAAEDIAAPHCFTTRFGGVSTGIFSSLNLNFSRGDDPALVVENYRRLGAVLGFTPEDVVNARQIHSDIVVRVDETNRGKLAVKGTSPECDALITNTQVKKEPVRNKDKKIGPNDPCPCGSGKKYKKCCMQKDKME